MYIIYDQEQLELKIPNEETCQVFEDTDRDVDLNECKDVNDLFDRANR